MSKVDVLERMAALNVLVIGDAMWDEYRFGECTRLAQEAPVPVFEVRAHEKRFGGAANVAAQIGELCGVRLLSPPDRCTKVRYIAGTHQLLRIDDDRIARSDWYDRLEVATEVQRADVVVLSDYAKGALTEPLCRLVMDLAKLVVVDPKGTSWQKYQGAHVICPNEREFEAWDGHESPPIIVHKRGSLGLRLIQSEQTVDVPACAQAVYDVTGAGDVIVSVIAACLGVGMDIREAAALANRAAGWAVGQVGTTVVPRERFAAWLR
jgi:bifunctional ADP-heptose synthase (sugar kinase/adenylyltransferase)